MMKNNQKIPEGWSVKKLGDIGKVSMCKRIMKHETNPDKGIPFYKIGTFGGKPDAYISSELYSSYKNKYSYPKKGDILISAAGTIGRTVIFDGADAYFQDSNIVWISNDETKALNRYLLYYYTTSPWYTTTGGAILRLYNENISNAKILLPPLPEQEKIAGVLGTWDEAIEKLSDLIEQKKLLKKGLMQKLLSGKTRLPDFTQPWKEVKLGEIGTTYTGLSGKNKDDFGKGSYFIPYMNIYQNNKIDSNQLELVDVLENENQNSVQYGDIFFTTSSETPEEVGFASVLLFRPKEKIYLNSFCFGYRLNNFNTLLPNFAVYLFRSSQIRKTMFKLAQGATRFNLSKNTLMKEKVYLPSDITEQKAIADVLSTADDEINLLNQKLEALKEQKKGLMQQLLTGQIRVKVN